MVLGSEVGVPKTLALRDYQAEALEAIRRAAQHGVTRQLVCLPTGTGKTVLFSHLAQQRMGRVLILAHRDELIQQAVDKLHQVDPTMTVAVALERRRRRGTPRVLVGSVQALSRPARLAKGVPEFRTVIVDEAHHSTAPSYVRLLTALGVFDPGGPLMVGVTATPNREDKRHLSEVWERIVYRKTLVDMIANGYLTDLRALEVRLETDFSSLPTTRGDFDQQAAGAMLTAAGAPDRIAEAYLEHAAARPGLVFTPTVAVATEMSEAFVEHGIKAAMVTGKTPLSERRGIVQAFAEGRVQVMVNCGVFTEGFDAPAVSCVVIARPTRSKALYVQMIGRGTRLHPSKSDCLVLDVAGVARTHDLMTSAGLFAAGETFAEGGSLRDHRSKLHKAKLEVAEVEDADDRRAEVTDSSTGPVNIFHGGENGQLQWLEVSDDLYVLTIAGGHVSLHKGESGWTAAVSDGGSRQVLASDLELTWAQGVAEDYVRSSGAAWLADPTAQWRRARPSNAQMRLLARMGVAVPSGCTRGQASDLITTARALAVASPEMSEAAG